MLGARLIATANLAQSIDSSIDAYASNVVALLHGEGTNGAATAASFVDSAKAYVPASVLNATISTARSKFGSASIALAAGYVRYASSVADFNLTTGDFTIEFWFYVSSSGTLMRLIQHQTGSASNSQYTYLMRLQTTGLIESQVIAGSTATTVSSGSAVTLNAWNHVAFVRNGTTLTVFLNGVPGASATGPANGSINSLPAGTLTIGADLDGSNSSTCNIDELRITKGTARYIQKFTVPTTAFPDPSAALGTVLGTENFILAGDGTDGSTTIVDSSSNALSFTSTNMTNSTAQKARGTGSLATGASAGYAVSPLSSKAYMGGASSWTIDGFLYIPAYPTSPAYWQPVFCSLGSGGWNSTHMFDLTVNNAGKFGMEWCNGTTTPSSAIGIGTALPIATWFHFAVTYDSSTKVAKIYINGVLDTTTTLTGFGSYGAAPRVTLGRTDPTVANPAYNQANHFMDRMRLTPSVRWTANFTPD